MLSRIATRHFSEQRTSSFAIEKIFLANSHKKHTKVVATLGPASSTPEVIGQHFQNGLNVCRLNFSHGTHETHGKLVETVREAYKYSSRAFGHPIMMDLKGPSIRTGFLKNKQPVYLTKGEHVDITTEYSHLGDKNKISCSYPKLLESVQEGDFIFVADGNLALRVVSKDPSHNTLRALVLNDYKLGEKKNMNLPGNRVDLPTITDKDAFDLKNFTVPYGIDLVSISFCRTAEDVLHCREILGLNGKNTKIVAKIENHEGINNLKEIVKEADAIMIARGDLGMEIPAEKITIAQKWMTALSREHLKPVIVATQMLESMTVNSRPTRAEIADVTNAVIDGTDCVMLSGETSAGNFPIQAVEAMRNISVEAENCVDFKANFVNKAFHPKTEAEALIVGAISYSLDIDCDIIVILSDNANHAKYCSLVRPKSFVLAPFTDDPTLRFFELFSGLYGVKVTPEMTKQQKLRESIAFAKKAGLIDQDYTQPILVIDCHSLVSRRVVVN